MGKAWDTRWKPGYTETKPYEDNEIQISVENAESLTVKAGTFHNCLKLTISLEKPSDDPKYYYANWHYGTKEYWYAPGVGVIKFICTWGNFIQSDTELLSYQLPAVSPTDKNYLPIHIGNKWIYEEQKLTAENYLSLRTIEIPGGMDGKYLICATSEVCYLGTEAEYEAFRTQV